MDGLRLATSCMKQTIILWLAFILKDKGPGGPFWLGVQRKANLFLFCTAFFCAWILWFAEKNDAGAFIVEIGHQCQCKRAYICSDMHETCFHGLFSPFINFAVVSCMVCKTITQKQRFLYGNVCVVRKNAK